MNFCPSDDAKSTRYVLINFTESFEDSLAEVILVRRAIEPGQVLFEKAAMNDSLRHGV
jgi:hypothetical protein